MSKCVKSKLVKLNIKLNILDIFVTLLVSKCVTSKLVNLPKLPNIFDIFVTLLVSKCIVSKVNGLKFVYMVEAALRVISANRDSLFSGA